MKILNKILGFVLMFFALVASSSATELQTAGVEDNIVQLEVKKDNTKRKVVVISDRVYQANQKYYVYPEVAEMIAQDVINELNKQGFVNSPSLPSVRDQLKNADIYAHASKLLNDYHYTYNIDFLALNKIAMKLMADDIVLITGGLDSSSDFLKPTWYSFLNIPGENTVKTEYRMEAHAVLIDVKAQVVAWEKSYTKHITATEFALGGGNVSPNYRQLSKLKKKSLCIAKDVAYRVESVLTPALAVNKKPPTAHERLKFNVNKKYDTYVQNINNKKEEVKKQKELLQSADKTEVYEQPVVLKNELSDTATQQPNEESKVEKDVVTGGEDVVAPLSVPVEVNIKSDELRPIYDAQKEDEKHIQVSPLNIIIPKM